VIGAVLNPTRDFRYGPDGVTLPPGEALICGFDILEAFGSDGVTLPPGEALICGFDMFVP